MASKEPNTRAIVARNIAALMRSGGLSVDQVDDRSGIERQRLDAMLASEAEATAEDLIRLAGAFGVEPGRLLE